MPEEDKNMNELGIQSVPEMMFGGDDYNSVVIESMTEVGIDGTIEDKDDRTVDEDEFYDAMD